MAEYKVVDAEQLDASLTKIANEVRVLNDTSDTMGIEEIPTNIAQVNANVDTQSGIIAQIKTALVGKASSSASEIEAKVDESGVLDGTEQSLDEKVDGLIDKSSFFNKSTLLSFAGQTITEIDFYLGNNLSSTSEMFLNCSKLTHLVGVNTSEAATVKYMFNGCAVVSIDKPFDFSRVLTTSVANAFFNANKLVDVRIVAGTMKWSNTISSPVLSDESIQSIVDGLADLTEKTAQTLTLHATVKAKLTEEQLAAITGKNWSVA